jgi:hypothetical protein
LFTDVPRTARLSLVLASAVSQSLLMLVLVTVKSLS